MKTRSALVFVAAVGLMVGCRSTEKSTFQVMQQKVQEMNRENKIAALGIHESRDLTIARQQAKLDARTQIAQQIETRISNLQKRFKEEVGAGDDAEINSLFSSATENLTDQMLQGAVVDEEKLMPSDVGYMVYAIVRINAKAVADYFKNEANFNTERQVYQRFRASQAFEELDEALLRDYKRGEAEAAGGGQ